MELARIKISGCTFLDSFIFVDLGDTLSLSVNIHSPSFICFIVFRLLSLTFDHLFLEIVNETTVRYRYIMFLLRKGNSWPMLWGFQTPDRYDLFRWIILIFLPKKHYPSLLTKKINQKKSKLDVRPPVIYLSYWLAAVRCYKEHGVITAHGSINNWDQAHKHLSLIPYRYAYASHHF